MERTHKLTVMMSDDEHAALTQIAAAKGLTLSDVVRQWMRHATQPRERETRQEARQEARHGAE